MFQAVRPYLTGPEPVVCYQGAVVADPATGEFLPPRADPARARARGDRRDPDARATGSTVTSTTSCTSRALTPEAERYATFQHIELHVVGAAARLARATADEARGRRRPRAGSTSSALSCARSSTAGSSSPSRCRSSSSSRTRMSRRDPVCSSSPTGSASRRRDGCVRRRRERPRARRLGGLRASRSRTHTRS